MEIGEKARKLYETSPLGAKDKPAILPESLIIYLNPDLTSVTVVSPGENPEPVSSPSLESIEEFNRQLLYRVAGVPAPPEELEKLDEAIEVHMKEEMEMERGENFRKEVLARVVPPVSPEEVSRLDETLESLPEPEHPRSLVGRFNAILDADVDDLLSSSIHSNIDHE